MKGRAKVLFIISIILFIVSVVYSIPVIYSINSEAEKVAEFVRSVGNYSTIKVNYSIFYSAKSSGVPISEECLGETLAEFKEKYFKVYSPDVGHMVIRVSDEGAYIVNSTCFQEYEVLLSKLEWSVVGILLSGLIFLYGFDVECREERGRS